LHEQLAQCSRLLPPADLQYAQQASDAAVRQQRLLARAFLRCTLAQYLPGAHPQQVKVAVLTAAAAAAPHANKPRLTKAKLQLSGEVLGT
jgi:hypothetical protein